MNARAPAILVVEDDPGDFGLLHVLLRQAGFAAIGASDASLWARTLAEGIAAAQGLEFAAVLLDLSLPDSSGLATVQAMRMALPQLPIVVLTGHDDNDLADAALESGAQDYLVKGQCDADALRRAVRNAMVRHKLELKIAKSEARFRLFFEKNTSVMLLVEPVSGEIMAANPSALAYYGYPSERIVGATIRLIDAMPPEALSQELQLAQHEDRHYFNFQHRLANGVLRDVEVYSTPIEQDGKMLLFSIVHDITARKQAQEQILHMAQHDALTGLANRALFSDRLQRALANARRDRTALGLMFIDLDKFKPVNDQFGHEMGDLLLQEVAQRMLASVRDSDIVARVGGDEFVVLLRNVAGEPEALAIAEIMRTSLEQPFVLSGQTVRIGCCVGVALYPQHGADDLTLFKNADQAMYQAKENGRNQVALFRAPPGFDPAITVPVSAICQSGAGDRASNPMCDHLL
jgi:diguanylate cyclase (GGDEF)-like protein/PAS domain S-box-containing protein